jgi:hypothetical protein
MVDITPHNHKLKPAEEALLRVAVDLHPTHLTIPVLTLRIANNPDDDRETQAIAEAIRRLRRCGLFRYRRRGKVVEPTPAALRAVELLTR